MKDAFGGILNLVFIVVFLLLVIGVLGLVVSYTKAFKMKNEIKPVIKEVDNMTKGSIPSFDINDKSAEYNPLKIIHGNNILITILFKGLMSSSDKKSGADTLTSPSGGSIFRYMFLMFFLSNVMVMSSIIFVSFFC